MFKKLLVILLLMTVCGFAQKNYSVKGSVLVNPIIATFSGDLQILNPALPSTLAIGMELETGFPYPVNNIGFHIAPLIVINDGVTSLMSPIVTLKPFGRARIGVGYWLWDSRSEFPLPSSLKTWFVSFGVGFKI